jgi:hypothetical protein
MFLEEERQSRKIKLANLLQMPTFKLSPHTHNTDSQVYYHGMTKMRDQSVKETAHREQLVARDNLTRIPSINRTVLSFQNRALLSNGKISVKEIQEQE